MKVEIAGEARSDVARLRDWLSQRDPGAATRAIEAIARGLQTLETFPDRGRLVKDGVRELPVKFGRYGYVIRYGIRNEGVIVARIFHALESR